jgi:hypothetical protein
MKFYFDNDGTCTWDNTTDLHNYTTYTYTAPKFSEVCAAIDDAACLIPAYQESLGLKRDWRDFKLLKISFYGEPNNTITADDKLFVSLTDGSPLSSDPNNAAIYHPDYTRLKMPWWQDWYIPLADFTAKDPTLDLSDIARIHIGIGNMLTKPTGGKGCIFIDDIELLAFGVRMPCEVDLNGDGIVNFGEVALLANNWLQTGHGLTGDINNDNIVNLTDLETILIYWLQTCHQPPQPKISYPENGAVISNNSRVLITEYDESGEDDIIEVIMEYSGDGITWQPIDNAIDNSDEWLGTYETMWDTSELESGPYHLRTIMTDQTGQQGMDEIEILMNLAPVADFNINSYEIDYVNKITNINFSADSSYDPDGNIMNYKWDFGDGSYDYGQYVSHNYPFGSEYVIQLKTVDDLGTESLPKPKDIIVDANEGTPVLVITHDCGCKKLTVKTAGKATIDFPPPHAKKSGPNDLGENIEIDVTDGVNDGKLKFNFEIEAELDPKTNDLTKCTYGQKVKRTSRSDSKTINKKDAAGNEYPVSGANYGDDDYNIASTFQTVDARNIRWIDAPGYWDLNDSDIKATGAKWEAEFIAYVKGNLGNCERKFKITLEVDKNGKVIKSEFKILQ